MTYNQKILCNGKKSIDQLSRMQRSEIDLHVQVHLIDIDMGKEATWCKKYGLSK